MSELDLLKQFRDDIPEPSSGAWLRARAAIAAARIEQLEGSSVRSRSRGPSARRPRRLIAALAGAMGTTAVVVTTIALTAGAAPTAAQAFPILTTKTTNLRRERSGRQRIPASLGSAHAFSASYGTGYVIQSHDASRLCFILPPSSSASAGTFLWGCGDTQSLEQRGGIFVFSGLLDVPETYLAAFVPVGGSLTITADGTTTTVPATNGIASSVVTRSETLNLQVGSSTTTAQVAPSSPAGWVSGGGTSATGPGGPSVSITGATS